MAVAMICGGQLILKRASASHPSGEWGDDDFDVLADGLVVGRIECGGRAGRLDVAVDLRLRSGRAAACARLCGDTRGGDGRVQAELATE